MHVTQNNAVGCKIREDTREGADLLTSRQRRIRQDGGYPTRGEGTPLRRAPSTAGEQEQAQTETASAHQADLHTQAVAQPCWDGALLRASLVRTYTSSLSSNSYEACMQSVVVDALPLGDMKSSQPV